MSSYRLGPSDSAQPWFTVGRVEVTTSVAVVGLTVLTWLAWVIVPTLPGLLALDPRSVWHGQVWRLVTWPLANVLGLWSVIGAFFFWYFGTELEHLLGRTKMLALLVGIAGSLTVAALLISALGSDGVLAGIGELYPILLLLWIGEYPTRRFWFGIPAWVFGAVLLGLQVLVLIGVRDWLSLGSLLLGLALSAVIARRLGLLSAHAWLAWAAPRSRTRRPAARPTRQEARRQSDRARLDDLLDKINEHGIGSLTDAEKRELHVLRDRLRGNR